MASAMVFVDDAVLGHLPPVCAKTGAGTVDSLVMTVPVGRSEGLGIAWLLILAGPIGWIGLLIYAFVRRDESLTVRLPYCDAAYNVLAHARKVRRGAGFATVLFALLAFFALAMSSAMFTARAAAAVSGLLAVGLFVVYLGETFQVRRAAVEVDLDGSRRWVTLSRISDPLAEAIKRSQGERQRPSADSLRAT